MMRGLGCLFFLFVIAWLGVEGIVLYETAVWMNHHWESAIGTGGWIICVGWTIAALLIGIKLGRWHLARIMSGLLNGTAGKHVIGLGGAVLLAIPGLLSDIPGILMLLPPVQILLGRLGKAVVAVIIKRTMGKMMGGMAAGMAGGFPGGFPGMPGGGGPFPGMRPMSPDERAQFPKQIKTIDTTAEKD